MRPFVLLMLCAGLACACQNRATHPSPELAMERCAKGMLEIQSGAVKPAMRASHLAGVCRLLFRESRCRQAWAKLAEISPEDRSIHLIEACRADYCPKLSDPLPALCSAPPAASFELRASQWQELMAAILVHELGQERANAFHEHTSALSDFIHPIELRVPPVTPPAAEQPRLIVTVGAAHSSASLVRGRQAEAQRWSLPARPSADDLAPLRAALAALPNRPMAIVQAEPQVPYARLIEAMDDLREVGIEEIVLSPGKGE